MDSQVLPSLVTVVPTDVPSFDTILHAGSLKEMQVFLWEKVLEVE